MKPMGETPEVVERLREFFKKEKTPEAYQILSAIRGNDMEKQGDLKLVTAVIRGYIGLKGGVNCSGWVETPAGKDAESYTEAVVRDLKEQFELIKVEARKSGVDTHYPYHLETALQIIGEENLIKFVEGKE
jgi:hypothetical protein